VWEASSGKSARLIGLNCQTVNAYVRLIKKEALRDFSPNTNKASSKIVLVLIEIVLVLLLGAPSGFEYEYEYRTG
jgi:hypothetical protein